MSGNRDEATINCSECRSKLVFKAEDRMVRWQTVTHFPVIYESDSNRPDI